MRYSPHQFVPGTKCDTYLCPECRKEVPRYQLELNEVDKPKRVDMSDLPCQQCQQRDLLKVS